MKYEFLKNKPTPKQEAIKCVLFGQDGVGKTTAILALRGKTFTIVGDDYSDEHQLEYHQPENYTELNEMLDYILIENHGYESLAIDNIEYIISIIGIEVCKSKGIKDISEGAYSSGYAAEKQLFEHFLQKLSKINDRGIEVLINAHVKQRTGETIDGSQFSVWASQIREALQGALTAWAEVSLVALKDTIVDGNKKRAKMLSPRHMVYTNAFGSIVMAKNRRELPIEMDFDMAKIIELYYSYPIRRDLRNKILAEMTVQGIIGNDYMKKIDAINENFNDQQKLELFLSKLTSKKEQ